ncbi:MAG: hypothetical protein KKF65_03215 [Nanoarchaeota archaeon]|nr:hypothetical protein [Nanoarchaeota archaeon]
MSRLYLEIAIDTSGQPCETIFIGLASVKTQEIGHLEKKFKREFSVFYKSSQKGTKRTPEELLKIVTFLNKNGLKMHTIRFKSNKWFEFIKEYKDISFLSERIYSVLYFALLKQVTFTNSRYRLTVCNENYLDIQKVIDFCTYLSETKNRRIEFTVGFAKNVFLIRLADFIAAAYRKVKIKDLEKLNNFNIIGDDVHYSFFDRVFNKSRFSKTKKKK